MTASWLDRSVPRERLLFGVGFALIGIILARSAIVGPASSCDRAPLHRGGDMVPLFCADYGAAWSGWPLLVAGLACIALGVVHLFRAAGGTRFPVVLRAALLLWVMGSALVYASWSEGSVEICQATFNDSSPGMPSEASCRVEPEAWRGAVLVSAGALLGAGATLTAAVAVRSAQTSGSDARVAAR